MINQPSKPDPSFFDGFPVVGPAAPTSFGNEPPPIVTDPKAGVEPSMSDRVDGVLKVRDVRKSYNIGGDRRWVLDGVDFDLRAGECVFLCGPSGSGKSTLLSIMGCLLECDSGEISIAGLRADRLSVKERTRIRRDHIGFVFQRFQLIRGLSAQDNVAVPLTLQGMSLSDAREKSADLLCRVGLELHRNQLPTEMSPGQCQRVALARAIIASPTLLLADEPTAALDGKSGVEVMELLRELVADTGSATVVVTHDPRILRFADRVCEIENGQFK